jgi:hypothetical protein
MTEDMLEEHAEVLAKYAFGFLFLWLIWVSIQAGNLIWRSALESSHAERLFT